MKGKMESTELKPEFEQIRTLLQVKAESMVDYLRVIGDMQYESPSFAYNMMEEIGHLAVGFYSDRKRYQEVIKEYELQKLNEMADNRFRPDEPPTGGGEDDDDDIDQPTISQEQPSLTRDSNKYWNE